MQQVVATAWQAKCVVPLSPDERLSMSFRARWMERRGLLLTNLGCTDYVRWANEIAYREDLADDAKEEDLTRLLIAASENHCTQR